MQGILYMLVEMHPKGHLLRAETMALRGNKDSDFRFQMHVLKFHIHILKFKMHTLSFQICVLKF